MLSHQGHRLLQIGVGLFLLTSFEGFVIPSFAAPRLGLSAHFVDGVVGCFVDCDGIGVAKATSWNRRLAIRALVVDLFEFSNRRCLFAGRHVGCR